jgi:hypothetical protein
MAFIRCAAGNQRVHFIPWNGTKSGTERGITLTAVHCQTALLPTTPEDHRFAGSGVLDLTFTACRKADHDFPRRFLSNRIAVHEPTMFNMPFFISILSPRFCQGSLTCFLSRPFRILPARHRSPNDAAHLKIIGSDGQLLHKPFHPVAATDSLSQQPLVMLAAFRNHLLTISQKLTSCSCPIFITPRQT